MKYNKVQKIVSSFLIGAILFSITFRFPISEISLFDWAQAWWNKVYSLVSVLVNEDIYDSIKSEINTYSEDIQKQLNNARVVIIPTPKNASAFQIASLNENLYYEWYKWVKKDSAFESKLIWTVLIWDFDLPVVFDWTKASKTIFPFVDFDDKKYFFNHKTSRYEINQNNLNWLNAEIWHWIISPNLWTKEENIKAIKDYFEKNHNFYKWTWNFENSKWIPNWKKDEELLTNYKPFVFYFDQFREQESISYTKYKWYEAYLWNKEDLVYSRYSKELAEKLKKLILTESNTEISSLIKNINSNFDPKTLWSWPDLAQSSDIATRYITDNVVKSFLEVLNSSTIWDSKKDVFNSWRYNWSWTQVNVDFVPYIISILDTVWDAVIKWANNDLENNIDLLVKNWLSRNIAVPTDINIKTSYETSPSTETEPATSITCEKSYEHFFYWKQWRNTNSASDCSIYKWNLSNSWTLVETNRGLDISLVEWDANLCPAWWTSWYWWWASPLNLDQSNLNKSTLSLLANEPKKSIRPIFNIKWSKKIEDSSKTPTPLNCFENNYILSYKNEPSFFWESSSCELTYQIPIDWRNQVNWSCSTNNEKYSFPKTFNENYKTLSVPSNSCDRANIKLDWVTIKSVWGSNWIIMWENTCTPSEYSYSYKKIPSYITHKSPTSDELSKQISSFVTPNLPIDKDRYIDFIWASGNYAKINYPYLFRLKNSSNKQITFEEAQTLLDNYLDNKSKEINDVISSNNPTSLSWDDTSIFALLKTWNYPSSDVNLKNYLKSKTLKTLTENNDSKEISYYDLLVFSVFWNNISSVSAKYKYVFENYLSDQYGNNNAFPLAKNKKAYEIAYLWAPWNSSSMFVWVDPENKWTNPYGDIMSANINLNSQLFSFNTSLNLNWTETFKCAPPEWVMLWEWFPAIMCRLKEMLPPEISTWTSKCSAETIFMTDEEKENYYLEWNTEICQNDVDKNWLNDCLENELKTSFLKLESESERVNYWRFNYLKAIFSDKDGKKITRANFVDVKFQLVKIDDQKDWTVFDINKLNENSYKKASEYIYFKDLTVPSQYGEAKYSFSSKNKDSDIYFKTSFILKDYKWNTILTRDSNIVKVEIRWDNLSISSNKIVNSNPPRSEVSSAVVASNYTSIYLIDENKTDIKSSLNLINGNSLAKEKLVLWLSNTSKSWNKIDINYPLRISLEDDLWNKILEDISVSSADLAIQKPLFILRKSWNYKLKIKDKNSQISSKSFTILADTPQLLDLNLWTSILETGWTVSSNLVSIKDIFWNIVSWDFYDLKFNLKWNWLLFYKENTEGVSEMTLSTFEGYKAFMLKTNDKETVNKLNISLEKDGKELLTKSLELKTVSWIQSELILKEGPVIVWWWTYNFELILKDKSWKVLEDFNSRAYLNIPELYWNSKKSFFEIKNWRSLISFSTKNIASKWVNFNITVEWLKNSVQKEIPILPDKPMKLDLSVDKSKLEADAKDSAILSVELKDRYWNLVFNDNSTSFSGELLSPYDKVISLQNTNVKSSSWKAFFKINSTDVPWRAYLKIIANPSLENNTFTVWTWSTQVVVKWVSANTISLDSYFFWNKKAVSKQKYNSIYTTLLWSDYWNIDSQDYLAWSLIFDKANRSLAVTTLLNSPYNYSDVINIFPNGALNIVTSNSDLSQDLKISTTIDSSKSLNLEIFNNSLNIYIGKVFYNFSSFNSLKTCLNSVSDFSACQIPNEESTFLLSSFDNSYKAYANSDLKYLENSYGTKVFSVSSSWEMFLDSRYSINYDEKSNEDYTIFDIKSWENIVAKFAFYLTNSKTIIWRDEDKIIASLPSNKNSVFVYMNSSLYWTRDIWSKKDSIKTIYYNDPFANENTLNSFSSSVEDSYETFVKNPWVGWKNWNKTLLSFSSWKTVWESVKDYQSFNVINIWDPVISLKNQKKFFKDWTTEKSFDSTIWKLLSQEKDINTYRIFDYDADNRKDILLVKTNNYFSLLENKDFWEWFLNRWNLAQIYDLWNTSFIWTWDFAGDKFEDIFFVNKSWIPFLLNNDKKDFTRISLEKDFWLAWKIVWAKTFDMDNDGKTDVVTLDDSWQINIFYSSSTSTAPKFTKLSVWSWYNVSINPSPRIDWAFVYFDSLPQISLDKTNEDNLKKAIEYRAKLEQALADKKEVTPDIFDESFVDNLIFVQIPYSINPASEITKEELVNSIKNYDSPELAWTTQKSKEELQKLLDSYSEIKIEWTNYTQEKTFVRSEYAESSWIKIEKVFLDKNSGSLQSWDLVQVTATIKNVSNKALTNVAYVDKINSSFEKTEKVLTSSKWKEKQAPAEYDILVDEFSLDPNETAIIKYELRTLPIKYWNLKVGLFEKWEVWDDEYWDIILSWDNKNCSNPVEIFRSIDKRAYLKWVQEPKCDVNKLELPNDLKNNSIDADKNWVPDYIDEIANNVNKQKDYWQKKLDEINYDSDKDWRPDFEDKSPAFSNEDSEDNFMDALNEINSSVDEISESIDKLIEWFGCWFGWGSCFATPLNWAPLAAWQDPTLFWMPIWDWLKVNEWYPIFSALNWKKVWKFCVPMPWPPAKWLPWCFWSGAWWSYWVTSPTNFARIFATPTLTWGFWVAACYWSPAIVAWYANPPWVSPLVPGWNCIVMAAPITKCSEDASEWDPSSVWNPIYNTNWDIWLINANCDSFSSSDNRISQKTDKYINKNFLEDYFYYKNTNIRPNTFDNNYKLFLTDLSNQSKNNYSSNSNNWGSSNYFWQPLIWINSWWVWLSEFSLSLDTKWLRNGNFEDVIEIEKNRVSPFPSFLMDWVTRQVEEFVTKLTDFPTLFVIMPSFDWLFDSDWWKTVNRDLELEQNKLRTKEEKDDAKQKAKIAWLEARKASLNCGTKNEIECRAIDLEIKAIEVQEGVTWMVPLNWINSVFDFLSNIPLIKVEPQKVIINYPVVDSSIDKFISNGKLTAFQWQQEIDRAKNSWKCSDAKCLKTLHDWQNLVYSLNKNLSIIEDYKNFPEKLAKLINQKEVRLQQLTCNVDALSNLTGKWIWQNWTRFKTWVEFFLLIKAILKSWQLMVDIFNDYDAECHECKNERNDLLNFQFKLIDMVMPKLPIIQFPKWPDIILDLHNIRVWLTVMIPTFEIKPKPVILPNLPNLTLPNLNANLDIDLPTLPILDPLEIPELPDLPSLPTIKLPDLPPPPKLPKLFASLEWVLNILKLITKAMCILKQLPFVPEWRSWDQIAFLTERQWYLNFDFLNLSLPQFSYPFVDAIKVTTFVNLETSTEFLVEMAKQMTKPINSSVNDFSSKFSNSKLDNLDYSNHSPKIEWEIDLDSKSSFNYFEQFAFVVGVSVTKLYKYIDERKSEELNTKEFIKEVNKSLSSEIITSHPKWAELVKVWDSVQKASLSNWTDKKIEELQKSNTEKFEELKNILNEEIRKNSELKKNIKSILKTEKSLFEKVSSGSVDDFENYNSRLDKYNNKFIDSANTFLDSINKKDETRLEIDKMWKDLLSEVSYPNSTSPHPNPLPLRGEGIAQNSLLAETTPAPTTTTANSCQQANSSDYRYNYKGIYIVEKNKSYRLFDYIDNLSWDEEFDYFDYDSDSDEDILYISNGELFLKNNNSKTLEDKSSNLPILLLESKENKFFNKSVFYEAVNNFREVNISGNNINVWFSASSRNKVNNYRLEFFDIVDKFTNIWNSSYTPKKTKKTVIDAFNSIEESTLLMENTEEYTIRKNLARIKSIWNLSWTKFIINDFKNLWEALKNSKELNISPTTKIYTWKERAKISYNTWKGTETKEITIPRYSNIEFGEQISLQTISWDAYVALETKINLSSIEIFKKYEWLPLLVWAELTVSENELTKFNEISHIEISYYDETEFWIDFRDVSNYILYDLWMKSDNYLIRVNKPNDYYYAKISSFANWIFSTISGQDLLAPQVESDTFAPEINVAWSIRIPVYQKKEIDFTSYIYENSGFGFIKDFGIDFDLATDSNGDWILTNDKDTDKIQINFTPSKISVVFWEYDKLFTKNIWITVTDKNWNIWYKEVPFEVYAPNPEIESLNSWIIKWSIDEKLEKEPVNIYRVRSGQIKKLEDKAWIFKVNTWKVWDYNFDVSESNEWLELSKDWKKLATIDEYSWKVVLHDLTIQIKAWTTKENYPELTLVSDSGLELFKQSFKLADNSSTKIVTDLENINKEWLFLRFLDTSSYNYYEIPSWASYNPWVIVIYKSGDVGKIPIFTIFPDWRIIFGNASYSIEYTTYGSFVWFRLVSKVWNTNIAELLYKVKSGYILK